MLTHPQFDPVAVHLGPLAIHWYGLMYILAFGLFLFLGRLRLKAPPFARLSWKKEDLENILTFGMLGVILGGRLGYVVFYKPLYYLQHPLEAFAIWQGGMSFHGGLIGVALALWWFARKQQRSASEVIDFVAPCVPLGLAVGRLGNFINGELWGRVADPNLPWAMVFPQSGSLLPRHPSQLYQMLLEGVLLFVLLWIYAKREHKPGQVAAAFLFGYGVFRFIAEYFREPDSFLGLLAGSMSMGQWLSLPMIFIGALWWNSAKKGKAYPTKHSPPKKAR